MWKIKGIILLKYLLFTMLSILILCILESCQSESSSIPGIEIVELEDYETVYEFEENQFDSTTLLSPSIVTYDNQSNLFVYDRQRGKVFELDGSGDIINEYGRVGRGPGEFRFINSITLQQNHLYLVDHWQFFIHKYNRNGELVSSMNYGSYTTGGQSMLNLLSAVVPEGIQTIDINNRPFVMPEGKVLLPLGRDKVDRSLYELRDWEGNYLADIGEVPEGSLFLPEGGGEVFLSAIENREIPGILKRRAFPVPDQANHGELFLIYSATARIVKYDTTGRKLWERKIQLTPEIETITHDYFNHMTKQNKASNQRHPGTSIGMLRKYTAGVSSPEGELYLATYTDPDTTVSFSELSEPLWIHRFSSEGELIRRYKLISGTGTSLPSVFDIDFDGRRIFVVTNEAEIRAYPF